MYACVQCLCVHVFSSGMYSESELELTHCVKLVQFFPTPSPTAGLHLTPSLPHGLLQLHDVLLIVSLDFPDICIKTTTLLPLSGHTMHARTDAQKRQSTCHTTQYQRHAAVFKKMSCLVWGKNPWVHDTVHSTYMCMYNHVDSVTN